MKIKDVREFLNAKVLSGEDMMDIEVFKGCGSDLMSDVLAFAAEKALMLTGLINPQVIRTAEMMDTKAIVFVRGKIPSDDVIELARNESIIILCTEYNMFTSCGILYQKGLL